MDTPTPENRPLNAVEERLLRWMLENGSPEAKEVLPQLALARVTPRKCPCGCASFDIVLAGKAEPTGGMHPVAEFFFGEGKNLSGIFAYTQNGELGGVEVYAFEVDAPRVLPKPEVLEPIVWEPVPGRPNTRTAVRRITNEPPEQPQPPTHLR